MPLRSLVFFDLETTGLNSWEHEIMQFAGMAVDLETLRPTDQLTLRIKFDMKRASQEALKINHFDAELWDKTALTPADAKKAILHFLGQYRDVELTSSRTGRPYRVAQLAGYNSEKFDMGFLRTFFGPNVFVPVRQQSIDVMQTVLDRRPYAWPPQSLKLQDIYLEMFGKEAWEAMKWHDAEADVMATFEIWKELKHGS